METYEKILEDIRNEVSFGYETVRVYREPALQALQVGYSISPTGEPLTGEQPGDWRREWIVIGYEGCLGDPIFIDSLAEGFPVYTAMHVENNPLTESERQITLAAIRQGNPDVDLEFWEGLLS